MAIERGNGAPPKPGRNCTGSYGEPVFGDPFGAPSTKATTTVEPGRTYQTMTESDVPPLGTFRNTATQAQIPAMVQGVESKGTSEGSVLLSQAGPGTVPMIQPHEKGRFFGWKRLTLVRRSGGAGVSKEDNQDTIGTPNSARVIPAFNMAQSARAGERTASPSFTSTGTLVGNARHDSIAGRWTRIKRGAAG